MMPLKISLIAFSCFVASASSLIAIGSWFSSRIILPYHLESATSAVKIESFFLLAEAISFLRAFKETKGTSAYKTKVLPESGK